MADSQSIRVRAPADSEMAAQVLVDRYTVGLWMQDIDPQAFRVALEMLTDVRVDLELAQLPKPIARGKNVATDQLAYLHFRQPVTAASAAWHGGVWTLTIAFDDKIRALAEHAARVKLLLPDGIDTQDFQHAEDLFMQRKFVEARATYTDLRHVYALAAWALLRLGDLYLFENDSKSACDTWKSVYTSNPTRFAATLASLRAHALGCHEALLPDWTSILIRGSGRDDLIGQRLQIQARWALRYEQQLPSIQAALLNGREALSAEVYDMLWGRYARNAAPYDLVKMSQYPQLSLRQHVEGFDLALQIARAWCALDVEQAAEQTLAQAPKNNWVGLSEQSQKYFVDTVGGCRMPEDLKRRQKRDNDALDKIPSVRKFFDNSVQQIQDRLDAIQDVLEHEPTYAEISP